MVRSFRVPGERRDEKVAWGDVFCGGDGDVEFWGREVGPGFELPVCFDCDGVYGKQAQRKKTG